MQTMTEGVGIFDVFRKASFEQLTRWWNGVDPPPADFAEMYLDEVAFALTQHGRVGIDLLKQSLESPDAERRRAALYFLAWPRSADEDVHVALQEAFAASPSSLKFTALWGFIHLAWFPIERRELERLLDHEDSLLAAVAMCYLSRALPDESISILRSALSSINPRMREFACDEIGERGIVELRSEVRRLSHDPDEAVAQAAGTSLEFLDGEKS